LLNINHFERIFRAIERKKKKIFLNPCGNFK